MALKLPVLETFTPSVTFGETLMSVKCQKRPEGLFHICEG